MQKPLTVAFRNLDKSDFLKRLAEERAARLEKFYPRIIGCRVVIEAPHRSAEGHDPPLGVCVEVDVPGHPRIVAKEVEPQRDLKGDHFAVVNRAFDVIERQLDELGEKQRGKIKHHDNARQTGSVARLFPEQGYGFIQLVGGPELYFTRNAVIGGSFNALSAGTMVQITQATGEGPMGPQASSVEVLGAERQG